MRNRRRNAVLAALLVAAAGCKRNEPTIEPVAAEPSKSVKDAASPDAGDDSAIGDGRRLHAAASGDKLPCVATDSLYVRVGNRVDRYARAEGPRQTILPSSFGEARAWTARGDWIVWFDDGFAHTWSIAAGGEVRDAATVPLGEPSTEPTIHDRVFATRGSAMFCFGPGHTAPCAQLHGLNVVALQDHSPLKVNFAGGPPYGYLESVSRSGPFVAVFGEGAGQTLASIDPTTAKVRRIASVVAGGGGRDRDLAATDRAAYFIGGGVVSVHPLNKGGGVARVLYDPGAAGRVAGVFASDESTLFVAVAHDGEPDSLVQLNATSGAVVRTLRTDGRVLAAHGDSTAAWWCTDRGAYTLP